MDAVERELALWPVDAVKTKLQEVRRFEAASALRPDYRVAVLCAERGAQYQTMPPPAE